VGADDAEFLVKQFEPVFDKNDLINIDNFNGYVKLLINGATSQPFNIKFYPPSVGNEETAKNIKQLSRLKYGREKAVVEKEILERGKITPPPEKSASPPPSPPPPKPATTVPPAPPVKPAPTPPPVSPPAPSTQTAPSPPPSAPPSPSPSQSTIQNKP
jgi:hypothetical protein